jgi:NADH dehydrogenase FAD-containing subunit
MWRRPTGRLASGEFLPATLDGLETDRINRLVVRNTLQTTRDDNICAIGDCASSGRRQADSSACPDSRTEPRIKLR